MSRLIDQAVTLGRERTADAAAAISDYVRNVVDAAPPITDEQADAIAATLRKASETQT